MTDLRSDRGMSWMPNDGMWLSYLRVDTTAGDLTYDLAVDATGAGHPSPVAAGLPADTVSGIDAGRWTTAALWAAVALVAAIGAAVAFGRGRAGRPAL